MSSASKRQDDHDADREPVPPYPAEVDKTWQAFRVTLPAAAVDDSKPAPAPATDDDA
jgi:hypothetical protein